jgi:hypothetical protein
MKTGSGTGGILRLLPPKFKSLNIGIIDGRDLWNMPYSTWHNTRTKFHEDQFRQRKNIKVVNATI